MLTLQILIDGFAISALYALGATMHHALSGRDPALEPPFSFPPLRSLCPDVTPALCELVDQALKYDVALRMADAAEFRQRLMAIKSGTPMTMPQRNSSPLASARPQLKLPLSGVKSKEQQASAPTMLSNAIDTECPRCGRSIPVDSNFCSFCAADVTGRLQMPATDRGAHEAQTIVLDDVASHHEFPGPIFHERRRRRHPGRLMALVVVATIISVSFATRGAMAANRPIVEVLHFVGAGDRYIANRFLRHFLRLGLEGGVIGGGIAMLLFGFSESIAAWFSGTPVGDQFVALLGTFSLRPSGYLALAAQAVLIAAITAWASRRTLFATLDEID